MWGKLTSAASPRTLMRPPRPYEELLSPPLREMLFMRAMSAASFSSSSTCSVSDTENGAGILPLRTFSVGTSVPSSAASFSLSSSLPSPPFLPPEADVGRLRLPPLDVGRVVPSSAAALGSEWTTVRGIAARWMSALRVNSPCPISLTWVLMRATRDRFLKDTAASMVPACASLRRCSSVRVSMASGASSSSSLLPASPPPPFLPPPFRPPIFLPELRAGDPNKEPKNPLFFFVGVPGRPVLPPLTPAAASSIVRAPGSRPAALSAASWSF
mmetsp:Transcript_16105/g.39248  ORF Transcript_16105/g.39248 Transcript_16105/m.39248 type:complete len:271 (+) Transcript_16105:344-1156(+)